MSFQCYAHADNTREYIMTSDAQRINYYDFLLVLFSLCLVYILVRCLIFSFLLGYTIKTTRERQQGKHTHLDTFATTNIL